MRRKGIVLLGVVIILISGASVSSAGKLMTALPNSPWGIVVDLTGWTVEKRIVSQDGQRAMVRASKKEGKNPAESSMLTLFIEPAPVSSATAFRNSYADRLWKKDELNFGSKKVKVLYKDKRMSQAGQMALFEHVLEANIAGKMLAQKNIFGFLVRDGRVVRAHVSTMSGKPEAGRMIRAVVESVRFKKK